MEVKSKVIQITDVGNFNQLVKTWFDENDNEINSQLNVGDIALVKVFNDPSVPGGVYSTIKKTNSETTNFLGDALQDRESPTYQMKNDRYRIQYTENVEKPKRNTDRSRQK